MAAPHPITEGEVSRSGQEVPASRPVRALRIDIGTMLFLRYVASRLFQGAAVVLGAVIVTFLISEAGPNSAVALYGGKLSSDRLAAIERELGLDRPLPERMADYFGSALTGDFGTSIRTSEPALDVVLSGLPYTLLLAAVALFSAVVLAVTVAVIAVIWPSNRAIAVIRATAMALQGMPEFWLALMLTFVFAVRLGWLPSLGADSPASIILPAAALAIPLVSTLIRLLISDMTGLMQEQFVEALQARGIGRADIVRRHALLNSFPILITFLALQIGWLVGGTLVVENIFAWPGIGTSLVNAAQVSDVSVMRATVVIIALTFVVFNLLADLLVYRIDPRVRIGR